ncbi:hypothetical protein KCP91_12040 [Microvirga sp. SRT01]|uniref:Uncharacterized protein n=1 Tax=Sphingomonas longa TaxID=2778730 RepID=A0ABS2D832_9SPHN|nr:MULTISPECIES: hypothetical protein [Alphaproteobacteria]MBM6577103.1 hypothetical protein [Sphingomonas sp. BT552]MBR7710147.1 hypothetical protein [Microvirga sp. SRT01]
MAKQHNKVAEHHEPSNPGTTTVTAGTPIITRTETTIPISQPVNPMMTLENWMPLLGLIMAVATIVGLFTKHITSKFAEFEKAHKPIHDTLERDIRQLEHKLSNEKQKIEILDNNRQKDVERIVKLETQLHSIEKGQERIEHALEKMTSDLGGRIDQWAEQFATSLREVRNVTARPNG